MTENKNNPANIEMSLRQRIARPFVSAFKEFVATPFRVAKLATKEFGPVIGPLVTAVYFGLAGIGAVALISGKVSDPLEAGALAAVIIFGCIGTNRLATLETKEKSVANPPTPAI